MLTISAGTRSFGFSHSLLVLLESFLMTFLMYLYVHSSQEICCLCMLVEQFTTRDSPYFIDHCATAYCKYYAVEIE